MYFTYADCKGLKKCGGFYFCDGLVFLFEGGSGWVHVGNRLRDVVDLVVFPLFVPRHHRLLLLVVRRRRVRVSDFLLELVR